VQTKAAQELFLREGHRSNFAVVGIVLIGESDCAIFKIQCLYSTVGDSDSVGVAAQVREHHLRAGKGPFGVDNPFVPAEPTQPAFKRNWIGETRIGARQLELSLVEEFL